MNQKRKKEGLRRGSVTSKKTDSDTKEPSERKKVPG